MAINGTATNEVELTSKQAKFADCLLAGANVGVAARTAGISIRTSVRWNKDARIKAYVRKAKQEAFNETLQTLMAGVATPLRVLLEAMTDKEAPHSVKIRAAQIWLEQALDIHKMAELEEKVAELEKLIKQEGHHDNGNVRRFG